MVLVTWDAVNKGTAVTISNGNLTAVIPNNSNSVKASLGKTTGKWYWEVKVDSVGNGGILTGIVNNSASLTTNVVTTSNVRFYYGYSAKKYPENIAYGTAYGVTDIIGVALDLDNGTLEFYKNGVSQDISHTDVKSMTEVFPAISSGSSSVGNTNTVNFGATSFKHPIPQGYRSYDGNQRNDYANKVLISSGDGNVRSVVSEKNENIIPIMTNYTTPSGIASASSENTSYPIYQAFDGNISATKYMWSSVNTVKTGWLAYEFNQPQTIDKYVVHPRNDTILNTAPKDWTFEGSNDGINYTVLDTRSGISDWVSGEKKEFIIKPSMFKKFRINVSLNNGGTYLQILELELHREASRIIKSISSQSEQNFINHGMSPSDLVSIDMSAGFAEKHYIQDASIILGEGKVFEHVLDTNKVLKTIKIN